MGIQIQDYAKFCNYTYNTELWRQPVLNEEVIVNLKS